MGLVSKPGIDQTPYVQPWASVIQVTLNHQEVPDYFQKDDTNGEQVLQTNTCTPRDIISDNPEWTKAFEVELDSFLRMDVKWDEHESAFDLMAITILLGKVVMVKKLNGNGTHERTRVVVCGNFQQVQPGEETSAHTHTHTHTPSFPMLRVLITMASLHGWSVVSWDVSTAFLDAPLLNG